VERLEPIDPENVRMYVCGPTVYDRAHLGNARPVVVFDVLYRLLKHVYGPEHVTYVRNITDVEDKIIDRAAERGVEIDELTRTTTEWFHEDMAALGVDYRDDPQFKEPRATDFIPRDGRDDRTLIAARPRLCGGGACPVRRAFLRGIRAAFGPVGGGHDRGRAGGGGALQARPDGFRAVETVERRSARDGTAGCGEKASAGGGPAGISSARPCPTRFWAKASTSTAAGSTCSFRTTRTRSRNPAAPIPRAASRKIWMHNEMLQVEGKKMSKSLGNFFTVRDLLDQGVPGEVIRFVMLSTHYSKPMDWTEKKREEAEKTLRRWRLLVDGIEPSEPAPDES
jgi:cysteinyl-tRNA synthetase